jgi:tetratricopeptide (TPR) repeat protein
VNALFSALVSILLLSGPAAQPQGLSREQAAQALPKADTQTRRDAASRLGEVGTMTDATLLVNALRDVDEDVRDRAEQAMWRIWARSGDQEVDRLYQAGVEEMSAGDLRQSIATFTRIIELKPDFAEGWNKRATLYFLVGDLRKSLADCDEVMKRNPYHLRRARRLRPDLHPPRALRSRARVFAPRAEGQPQHGWSKAQHRPDRAFARAAAQGDDLTR